jgi:hypothetical protein
MTACQKADGNFFWAREGMLMVGFMQQGTTVMSEVYCETEICIGPSRTKGVE